MEKKMMEGDNVFDGEGVEYTKKVITKTIEKSNY